MNQEIKKEFESFCKTDFEKKYNFSFNPHELIKMPKPFKEFVVIKNAHNVDEKFLAKYNFKSFKIDNIEIIAEKDLNSAKCVYSGLMNYNNTLIMGEEDLKENIDALTTDNIGYFTYLKIQNGEVEIGNDYMGNGKLYAYRKKDTFIISNHYHLLLLTMKNLDIKMEFNQDIINAILSHQGQLNLQLFCRQREIKNTYLIPIDEKILLTSKKTLINKKEIYDIIGKNKLQNYFEYRKTDINKLLEDGIKEIENNIRTIITDERFKNIYLDLTGGLDSRVVFGIATTRLKEELDKKHVMIRVGGTLENIWDKNTDAAIACTMNSEYGYDYILPINKEIKEEDFASLGLLYGTWEYNLPSFVAEESETAILSGGSGESFLRPYYSRKILNKFLTYNNLPIGGKDSISRKSFNCYKKLIANEIKKLPGKDIAEKFDMHYIFYYNPFHFYDAWRYKSNNLIFKTIHSKSLLKYKFLTWKKASISAEENFKVFDKIGKMFLFTPFDHDIDEKERVEYIKHYYGENTPTIFDGYSQEKIKKEKEKYLKFREERDKNLVHQGNEKSFAETFENRFESILHELILCNKLFKGELGRIIYKRFRKNMFKERDKKILYFKLVSLLFETKLIQDNK